MKNYYEILEVDSKASAEVIEKAYKTLVKKYHPDVHDEINQYRYENKMKEINEAYSILSDNFKRASYDEQLESTIISKDEYEKIVQENIELKRQIKNLIGTTTQENPNTKIYQSYNNAYNNAYKEAYGQDMKNRGYKIRYKHNFKYYVKLIGYILLTILIFFLIYQIPIVKKIFTKFYEENTVFRLIVDIFRDTFSARIF